MRIFKQFAKGFFNGFRNFGHNIIAIVNSTLLLLVYLIGVGFTKLFAKISRKNFLDDKISKERESYWTELNLNKKPLKEYYRQF